MTTELLTKSHVLDDNGLSVRVVRLDRRFFEIHIEPICSCDKNHNIMMIRRSPARLERWLRRWKERRMFNRLLECPEIYFEGYRCESPCCFRESRPDIMAQVQQELARERAYRKRHSRGM